MLKSGCLLNFEPFINKSVTRGFIIFGRLSVVGCLSVYLACSLVFGYLLALRCFSVSGYLTFGNRLPSTSSKGRKKGNFCAFKFHIEKSLAFFSI